MLCLTFLCRIDFFYDFFRLMGLKLLLTGLPGVGKTTLIQFLANELGKDCAGFYTEEVREGGKRVGFDVVTLSDSEGGRGVLARVGATKQGPMVGQYTVMLEQFEHFALQLLPENLSRCKVILIDEIGKMECMSRKFQALVRKIYSDSSFSGHIVATIPQSRGKPLPLVRELVDRNDTEVLEVTRANRDQLRGSLLSKIT